MSADSEDAKQDAATPPVRKRRWRRRLIAAVVLVAGIGFLGPVLAAPWVRGIVVGKIEAALDAKAEIEGLSFDLAGNVSLSGLTVETHAGRRILSVDRIGADVGVLAALTSSYVAEVSVDGFEVHAWREADGRWNLEPPERGTGSGPRGDEPRKSPKPEDAEPFPSLAGALDVANGRVVVHGAAGETELHDVSFHIALESVTRPAAFRLGTLVSGPDGPGGRVTIDGELVLDEGETAGSAPFLTLALAWKDGLLEALEPALGELAPIDDIAGGAHVSGSLQLYSDGPPRGDLDGSIDGLRILGRGEGLRAAEVASVRIRGDSTADAQELSFELPEQGLRVAYTGTATSSDGADPRVDGELVAAARLAPLLDLAAAFVPIEAGLTASGDLEATTTLGLTLGAGALPVGRITTKGSIDVVSFQNAEGRELDLAGLERARFDGEVSLTEGSVEVSELTLEAGPIEAHGRGVVTGLDGESPTIGESELTADADLDRLADVLAGILASEEPIPMAGKLSLTAKATPADDHTVVKTELVANGLVFAEYAVDSTPITGETIVRKKEGGLVAEAAFEVDELAVAMPGEKTVRQRDVRLDVDFDSAPIADGAAWSVPELTYASPTLQARATVTGYDETSPVRQSIAATVDGELTRLLADLGAALGLEAATGSGELETKLDALLFEERTELSVSTDAKDLVLDWTSPSGVLKLREDRLVASGEFTLPATDGSDAPPPPADASLKIDSKTLAGRVGGKVSGLEEKELAEITLSGWEGELTYVPDRLGALLQPWIPGELTGAEPERAEIRFDGQLDDLDVLTLLANSTGTSNVGLGRLVVAGFDTKGAAKLDFRPGRTALSGEFTANGGKLVLDGELALRKEGVPEDGQRSRLHVGVETIQSNAELSQLLGYVHPAFGALESVEGTDIAGLVTCDLELVIDGPLDLDQVAGGWKTLPKNRISGRGKLELTDAVLNGSPFFKELLESIGKKGSRQLKLDPVEFEIKGGRIAYDGDWTWTIAGSKTTFGGSIGLDQTLKLDWNVPVTQALVKKHSFLEHFEGETLRFPIGGTVTKPKLELDGVLKNLARDAAKRAITKELGIDDILGGGGGKDDPAKLLKEADRLWDEGKKKEAAKIYDRIRDDFSLSPVYLLNRDRIKERRKYEDDV